MECKNCDSFLSENQNYCPSCGAKIIRNRLTVKNLWSDFSERFLNVDNTFFRTFIHLFTKPEAVIKGFINGVRKKYVNPIGYLAFSIILSGLMFVILKNGYEVEFTAPQAPGRNLEKALEYQALITYLGLPLFTISSFLVFIDRVKYNLSEHFVINCYWLGQFSIVQFLVSTSVLGVFDIEYNTFSSFEAVFLLIYLMYILKRIYQISFWSILVRGILYIPLYGITMLLSVLPIVVFLFLTGEFKVEEFLPKK